MYQAMRRNYRRRLQGATTRWPAGFQHQHTTRLRSIDPAAIGPPIWRLLVDFLDLNFYWSSYYWHIYWSSFFPLFLLFWIEALCYWLERWVSPRSWFSPCREKTALRILLTIMLMHVGKLTTEEEVCWRRRWKVCQFSKDWGGSGSLSTS